MQMKSKQQKGFTIIELVVVILLLGILAATALPRFMDVTDEAHVAVVDAVQGGLSTGSAMFRAQWIGKGQPTGALPEFGDGLLYSNASGYPIGLNDTLAVGDCVEIFNGVLQGGRPTIASATVANGAALTVRETAIEGAAANVDFVAVLEQAADIADSTSCTYYYVGQYKSGAAAPNNRVIPSINYDFTTGAVTRSTFDLTN